MKTTTRNFCSAIVLGAILAASGAAFAQTTTVQSTTTTAGTITQFSPDAIVIRTEAAAAPVTYSYTKTTTYVDESGAPVSIETVKSGLPVTVYYVKDGDRMVASKVVVRKVAVVPATPIVGEQQQTTTTTTTTR